MKKFICLLCFLIISFSINGLCQTNGSDLLAKARKLQKQLNLTDAQMGRVVTIFKESSQKFEKIRMAAQGDMDKMLVSLTPLRSGAIKKIRIVLTPVQAAKFDQLVKQIDSLAGADRWSARQLNPDSP